jgi:hypothetical protein
VRRRTGPMGVFSDRTLVDRILFADFQQLQSETPRGRRRPGLDDALRVAHNPTGPATANKHVTKVKEFDPDSTNAEAMGAEVVRQRVDRSVTFSGEAIRPVILIVAQHAGRRARRRTPTSPSHGHRRASKEEAPE